MTPSAARDVLRAMGVPVPSVDDILFVSEPVKYKNGRLRLFILTRTMLVYARSLDPWQSLCNLLAAKGNWDLDWAAPTDNLAFIDDDDGRVATLRARGRRHVAAQYAFPAPHPPRVLFSTRTDGVSRVNT